jgi:hypothetical protein
MRDRMLWLGAVLLLVLSLWPAGIAAAGTTCPVTLPQGSDPVTLDPAGIVNGIDNEYWPMAVGTRWTYRESDLQCNAQKFRVVLTPRAKRIEGIPVTVVHDVVSEHGETVEDTWDWYAQDVCGNVWYLGENTKEYEDGHVVTTAGSWKQGVDGAMAGVAVPADPQVGLSYRQEYYAGEAEDSARVLSLNEQAQVPYGHFRHVLLTKDFTPLHPRILEYKLYAKGIGPILVFGVSGGSGTEELIRYHAG